MTTHEYLSQLINIDNRISDKILEAERWRELATSTGGNALSEKVKSSTNYYKMENAITNALVLEEEYNSIAVEMEYKKDKITKQLDKLSNQYFYNILKGYYLNSMSYSAIGRKLNVSYKQVKRDWIKALDYFESIYGTEYLDNSKDIQNCV